MQSAVEAYLGIDPSEQAINYAKANYQGSRIRFELGTLEANSCGSLSIDTFLMFETLEHTSDPIAALRSIRSRLKQDGLLIGSVPSAEFEALCESTYGQNPFHLHRFTREQIYEMLCQHFGSVRIFSMEFILGSLFQSIDDASRKRAEILLPEPPPTESGVAGSIVFMASSRKRINEAVLQVGAQRIFIPSIPKVILDRDEVEPIRASMQSMEALIQERDKAIATQAQMLEERWAAMQSMEALIQERDKAIAAQAQMLEERWAAMQAMEAFIRERDEAIAGQAGILEERWVAMQSMEALIQERDEAIAGQAGILEERWVAMQSMEALIQERDEAIIEQRKLLEKRPTIIEAMLVLLFAFKASLQHRAGRVLGKIR